MDLKGQNYEFSTNSILKMRKILKALLNKSCVQNDDLNDDLSTLHFSFLVPLFRKKDFRGQNDKSLIFIITKTTSIL